MDSCLFNSACLNSCKSGLSILKQVCNVVYSLLKNCMEFYNTGMKMLI